MAVGAVSSATSAGAAEDPELEALEKAFAGKIEALQAPITTRYLEALEELARELASAGRSTAAVTKERRRVEALRKERGTGFFRRLGTGGDSGSEAADDQEGSLFSMDDETGDEVAGEDGTDDAAIPRSAPGDVVLLPQAAKRAGSVERIKPQDVLGGFKAPGDNAAWTIDSFAPGLYDVILDYASGTSGTGGGRIAVHLNDTKGEIEIRPRGKWTNFRYRIVGGAQLDRPPATVRIEALESTGDPGILALRSVILRPRRDDDPDTPRRQP